MISADIADNLLTTWTVWSRDDAGPKTPGNHWNFSSHQGYRETRCRLTFEDSQMLQVDSALASLRRDFSHDYRQLMAYYRHRKPVPETALDRALRLFVALY